MLTWVFKESNKQNKNVCTHLSSTGMENTTNWKEIKNPDFIQMRKVLEIKAHLLGWTAHPAFPNERYRTQKIENNRLVDSGHDELLLGIITYRSEVSKMQSLWLWSETLGGLSCIFAQMSSFYYSNHKQCIPAYSLTNTKHMGGIHISDYLLLRVV